MIEDEQPFSPSVFDRIFHWMDERPVRKWWYAITYVLLASWTMVALSLEKGWSASVVSAGLVDSLWPIVLLGAIHFFDAEVVRAARRFREVFNGNDAEYEVEVYRLSTMPARTAAVIWLASFLLFAYFALFVSAVSNLETMSARAVYLIPLAFQWAPAPLFIYHTIRLLIGVSRVLRSGLVNVFNLRPLYGFSVATAKVGALWMFTLLLNYISEVVLELGGGVNAELVLVGSVLAAVIAVVSFVAPLWGTHNRIVEAKSTALGENSAHIERLRSALYRDLEAGDAAAVRAHDEILGALLRMGETISSISVWPWSRGTSRTFFTAVGTPLVVWLLQRLLGLIV